MTLVEQPMRLKYVIENVIYDAGRYFAESWYNNYLDGLFKVHPDAIFFLVVETTDVFEKEFNYNTIASYGPDGMINHTYSPYCSEGCRGQREDCFYKQGGEILNDSPPFPRSKGSW